MDVTDTDYKEGQGPQMGLEANVLFIDWHAGLGTLALVPWALWAIWAVWAVWATPMVHSAGELLLNRRGF